MRSSRLAALSLALAFSLSACSAPTAWDEVPIPDERPSLGTVRIAPSEGGGETAWRITEATYHPRPSSEALVSFLSLGGPEDASRSRFSWHLSIPVTGDLREGRVIDLAPDTMAYGYVRRLEFSGGVPVGAECGTPNWSYGSTGGRVTITEATDTAVSGVLETTVQAPFRGRFGPTATVRAAFRAAVHRPETGG